MDLAVGAVMNGPWDYVILAAVVIGIIAVIAIINVAKDRFSGNSQIRGPELTGTAQVFQQMPGSRVGPIPRGADLLASGQRVPGVLMSFADNGDRADSTYSRPELRDAPYYLLTVELHIPNLAPMTAKNIQPVPPAVVPNLVLGLQLTCAVDPADPSNKFAVDWRDFAY